MNHNFKQQVSEYFRGFRLSRRRLARLEALQADQRRKPWPGARILTAPALQMAIIVLILVSGILLWQTWDRQSRITGLSAEIAYNHNKQMAMEITSPSLPAVSNYLSKLDFALIESQQLPGDTWELLGGRYCALGGKLAAQLKMRHRATDQICTLFQTGLEEEGPLGEAKVLERHEDGVKVTLWAERGLLLGMAGEL
jgi:anti-sigma factor RsiW